MQAAAQKFLQGKVAEVELPDSPEMRLFREQREEEERQARKGRIAGRVLALKKVKARRRSELAKVSRKKNRS